MTEVRAVVEENTAIMKKAPRGKEGAAVLESMKADMVTIEASIVEAQGMYDKAAYMDASNKVKAAKEKATGINTELKEAIAKVRR